MASALKNRSFLYLWTASLVSTLGSQISRISLVLFISDTGGSAFNLALLIVLEMLPGAITAPVAGVFIDRFNRRSVMITSELLQMLFVLTILAWPTPGAIYLMVTLRSVAAVFFQPARAAALALIVDRKQLQQANGLDQSAYNLVLVLGPIAGAKLLISFGLGLTLLLDALSFLLCALLISRLKIKGGGRNSDGISISATLSEIKEGWQYILHNRLARYLNLLLFMDLLCTGVWLPLAPFFIRDHLGASEDMLGWQLSLFGIGAVIGGVIAPLLIRYLGLGLTLFIGLVAEGGSLTLYALVSNISSSMAVVLIWGMVLSLVVVPFYSILQVVVEERFLGRVFSVARQSENLATVMSMAAAVMLQGALASYSILLLAGLSYMGFALASSLSKDGRTLLATR